MAAKKKLRVALALRLDPAVKSKLEALAVESDRSLNQQINYALAIHVGQARHDEIEDREALLRGHDLIQ